jgi:hypothetical protein
LIFAFGRNCRQNCSGERISGCDIVDVVGI